MSNPNKAKGDALERDARAYLAEVFGRAVIRPRQEGAKDVGDLQVSPVVIQCKNYANIATALNVGVAGAEVQAGHAGEPFGVALIKKRGAGIAQARVAMTLATFRALLVRLRRAESLLARHAPEVFHTEHLPPPPETPEKDDAPSQTS